MRTCCRQLIGLTQASRLIATGAFLTADEALALGMVSEVVRRSRSSLAGRTRSPVEMTHGPVATYAHAKKIARRAATAALDAALDASLAANIELIALPEVRDRILDVMERYSARRA